MRMSKLVSTGVLVNEVSPIKLSSVDKYELNTNPY